MCLKEKNNREMRRIYGLLIEWIFFFFSLGKYLFCLCTKMLIITAPFWKPFHWSVRSWAGATRGLYGPSPLQRSEPLQVQESNTYPGTKEISQQGRTTGGNCSPAVPPTLLMTLSKRHEREGCLWSEQCTQAFYVVMHQHICVEIFAELFSTE